MQAARSQHPPDAGGLLQPHARPLQRLLQRVQLRIVLSQLLILLAPWRHLPGSRRRGSRGGGRAAGWVSDNCGVPRKQGNEGKRELMGQAAARQTGPSLPLSCIPPRHLPRCRRGAVALLRVCATNAPAMGTHCSVATTAHQHAQQPCCAQPCAPATTAAPVTKQHEHKHPASPGSRLPPPPRLRRPPAPKRLPPPPCWCRGMQSACTHKEHWCSCIAPASNGAISGTPCLRRRQRRRPDAPLLPPASPLRACAPSEHGGGLGGPGAAAQAPCNSPADPWGAGST